MKTITVYYRGAGDTPCERTLVGHRVGYGFNPPEEEQSLFRIWGDGVTFGVPFESVISFEIREDERHE